MQKYIIMLKRRPSNSHEVHWPLNPKTIKHPKLLEPSDDIKAACGLCQMAA